MRTVTAEMVHAENDQLKAEVVKLRKDLLKEQRRSADLEEELLRLRMLYSTSTACLPVGDFVEVDDGYFMYSTSATPVLDAQPVESSQCGDSSSLVNVDGVTFHALPAIDQDNDAEDDDAEEEEGPNPTSTPAPTTPTAAPAPTVGASLLRQTARRGPVHITSWRGTRVISEAFAGHVSQLCSAVGGLVCLFDSWDQWIVVPIQGTGTTDQFALRSSHGMFLCAEPNGTVVADRLELDEWEKWTAVRQDEGGYAFRSCHGKYLCAEPDGRIVCNRHHAAKWETFVVALV